MVKRNSTEAILDVACSVAKELVTFSPKKKAKKSKNDFFINHKDEFMLTYANTYNILTKIMVEEMLKSKNNIEKYIISLEHCHNTDDHEHIHVYLKLKSKFSTRDKRCFDVFSSLFNNESHSNHPNIRYKGDSCFGKAKKGDQATYDMVKYVTKEDKEPLSNWNWQEWLEWFELNGKKDTRKVKIPFFDWVHEEPIPLQEEVYRRIRENRDLYQNYLDYFLQINSMIKQDFPTELPCLLTPDFDLKFYIPKKIKDWIDYFEDWWKSPFDRCKGLWITGCTRSAKTSLIATLGPNNYFPNVWNYDNFNEGRKFNFFDDQDVVFESMEDFRYYKGFVGAQKVITISGKYKKPKTVNNNIPCVWCSNMSFHDQVKDVSTRKFIEDNMIIVELGQYDLKKINYPPKHTITGLYWDDYDPKDSYYYFIKNLEKEKQNTSSSFVIINDNDDNNLDSSLICEPDSSGYLNC